MAVPTVFMNGELFDSGRMTLEQIVGKLDTSSAERAAEAIEGKDPFEVLVVGGPRGRLLGPLRSPQGHPHRRRRRALRWPGARHHGHPDLPLGALHRGPHTGRPAGPAPHGTRTPP